MASSLLKYELPRRRHSDTFTTWLENHTRCRPRDMFGEGRNPGTRSLAAGHRWCRPRILSVVGEGVSRALTIVANLASPWGIGAFLVGRLASSPSRGAFVGGVALISGMVTFYLLTPALYLHGVRDIVWTIVAMIVGPLMGPSGALIATGRGRSHTAAVIAPSSMLLAEATWFASERRIWLSNFQLEPYRLNDVAVLGVLVLLGLLLPLLLSHERRRLPGTYLVIFLLSRRRGPWFRGHAVGPAARVTSAHPTPASRL